MNNTKFLIIGATGLVGSQVAIILAQKGLNVTAMVRNKGNIIKSDYSQYIKYVVGDLTDEKSIKKAVEGIDVVISSANGIIPQKRNDNSSTVNRGAQRLIKICEEAGVKRFVQSSVPTYKLEKKVPELWGKRIIEKALEESKIQSIIVRNPAFMDVWLVMCGFQQGENKSPHATTKRNYGFMKTWRSLVGNLSLKRGLFIAPGGASHGSPLISTRDVAQMMTGGALYEGEDNLIIESGGKEWLTWREVADIIAKKTGRNKMRIIPMPSWLARTSQLIFLPFSPSAANVMALLSFVAAYQPNWNSTKTIKLLNLPDQWSLGEYIDNNYE